jgi:hypothetical protein
MNTSLTAVAFCSMLLGFSCAARAADNSGWQLKAQEKGITVFSRPTSGSDILELKATGTINAPPPAVFKVLSNYAQYKNIMPYTEESRIIATEEGGKVVHVYCIINAPLVSRRDYTLRIVDESQWKDGNGFLKTRWTLSNKGPALNPGIVRVTVNEGSWLLEPIENGTKTKATYQFSTTPGGSLPAWVSDKANTSTIPDVFEALRKNAKSVAK